MIHSKTVLSLTTDLLAHHAFSHLRDTEISALHHLIIKMQDPLTLIQQNLLLIFWNHANTRDLPPALVYRCNILLQQLGRPPLEELMMEVDVY